MLLCLVCTYFLFLFFSVIARCFVRFILVQFFFTSVFMLQFCLNPFTATGRIYTSQKRPFPPRVHKFLCTLGPTSISFLRICQSPATDVVVVVCLRGVFFVSSLIAACPLGPCRFIEKTVLLCFARFLSKWRETALWMFPDVTQAGTICTFDGFRDDGDRGDTWFRLVGSATGMTVEIGWERKLVTGAPGGEKITTPLAE